MQQIQTVALERVKGNGGVDNRKRKLDPRSRKSGKGSPRLLLVDRTPGAANGRRKRLR
jgi:hypothetical protein